MTYTACAHQHWEPVLVDGETVANICALCLDRLPATYTGHTEAILVAAEAEPIAYVALPTP
jgi:hypothetical protein